MLQFLQNCKFHKENNHYLFGLHLYNHRTIRVLVKTLQMHNRFSIKSCWINKRIFIHPSVREHIQLMSYILEFSQLCLSVLLAIHLEDLALKKPSRFQGVTQGKEGMGPITQTHMQSRIKQSGSRRLSGSLTIEQSPRRRIKGISC